MSNNEVNLEKEKPNPKTYAIIVNGRSKEWNKHEITFVEIIVLAFGTYSEDPNVAYTVTFSKGENKKEGVLVYNDSVKVKEGMVFNATQTNKS